MPPFTTENSVRLRFQLADTTLVSAELIAACIDDAHNEIERALDPTVEVDPPDASLVTGETLLAGAYLFRTLAAKDAFQQREVSIGGQRIAAGNRFQALSSAASITEAQAWYILEPFLSPRPPRTLLNSTDSMPVLGEN